MHAERKCSGDEQEAKTTVWASTGDTQVTRRASLSNVVC